LIGNSAPTGVVLSSVAGAAGTQQPFGRAFEPSGAATCVPGSI